MSQYPDLYPENKDETELNEPSPDDENASEETSEKKNTS